MYIQTTSDRQSSSRSVLFGIGIVGMLVIIAMWTAAITSFHTSKEAAIEHARSEARNLAAAFADEVSRNLDGVAASMDIVARRIRSGQNPANIGVWAQDVPMLSGATIQAAIIGPDGKLISTTLDADPQPIDLSDREHIRVHLGGRIRGLFIGKPVLGRVSNRVTIQVTRRVDADDGHLLAIILFSLAPADLTNLQKLTDLGPHGVITLAGLDDVVRARFSRDSPEGLSGVGQSLVRNGRVAEQSQGASEGTFTNKSVVDGVERLFSYRRMANYPLIVTVGLGLDEALAAARIDGRTNLAITAVATLLLAGLAAYLFRDITRRQKVERQLRDAQAMLTDAVDSISEAFVIYDRDDRFVMCNEPFRRLYPDSIEMLVPGKRFEDLVRHGTDRGLYPGAVGREEEWIAARLAAHLNPSGAVENWLADGRCLLITERRMRNGGTAGLRIDITRLKEIEAQLRTTMDSLRNVQRVAGVGSTAQDLKTGKFTWSPEACAIFGVDMDTVEPTVEFMRKFYHPSDHAKIVEAAEQSRLLGTPAPPLEYRIIRPDGVERIVYRENAIEHDASGHPLRRIVTFKDITDLKSTENQLREAMEQLDRVQRIAGIGSLAVDIDAERIRWSPRACAIFGITPEDVEPTYEYLLSFVHPDDRNIVNDAALEAHASGVAAPPLEYRIIRADGAERIIYRENALHYDTEGRPFRRTVTYKDITELKATEAQLRKAMEHLDQVQRIAGIGSIEVDLTTGITTWSLGACTIFGVDSNDVEPTLQYVLSFVHPDDRPKVEEVAALSRARGIAAAPLEYRIIRPDGAERVVYREYGMQFDFEGRPIRRIMTFKDITHIKAAEAQLRRSQQHLAHAQRVAATGSFELDLRTRAIEWSDETYRIFGVTRAIGPINLAVVEGMVLPEDRPRIDEQIAALLEGRPDRASEYRIRRPDGRIHTLHREMELVVDSEGRPAKVFGVVKDITELREAEGRRDELERQLLHSQKLEALGTLAGGIAHELNNTLVPVLALSQLLMDNVTETDRDDLQMIVLAARRAKDLVQQVLAFSRKQQVPRTVIDPADAVRQALQLMRATLPPNIAVIEKIDNVPQIVADAGQLQQVVINLVTNAAQAIGTDTASITVEITVGTPTTTAELRSNCVQIRVSDSGPGIPKEILERIFEPFYTTKEVGEGTGLGLSVVHGIITAHGGIIEVSSEPGKGTVFTILLPVSEAANAPPAAAAA